MNKSIAAKRLTRGAAAGQGNLGSAPPVPSDAGRDPRLFQASWAEFLRATEGGCAARVSRTYAITPKGADKWLDQRGGPRGHQVVRALALHPVVARRYLLG